jgi:DNA modification methylase
MIERSSEGLILTADLEMDYPAFLASKSQRFTGAGFAVNAEALHPSLFPFQRDLVLWALRKGRSAIFADCGLGKTRMQLEWARHIPGPVIIFAPLCVDDQTIAEAAEMDLEVCRHGEGGRIQILNYERLHHVNPADWSGVVLDESSILKSVDGKTRGRLLEMFHATPYRLCCTATPAPNDPTEIGNHSHFLGIMTRAEMLGSFFINRGEGNRSWDLRGHARESFYRWLASWACFLRRPSDLGYSDEGFALSPLEIAGDIIPVDMATPGRLFPEKLKGVQDRAAVRRSTATVRVERAAALLREADGQAIAWCGLNPEQDALAEILGDECVSVYGSLAADEKVARVRRFLRREVRWLVTKPSIVGHGMNLQQAATQVFVGLSDSYEDYYQCIRRSWRYPQTETVHVFIVLSDLEEEILLNVKRKEAEAADLQEQMAGRLLDFERAEIEGRDTVAPYREERAKGDRWELWRGDCVEILRQIEPESVDFSVFSPPFAELYTYSASERDLGNSRDIAEFLRHFRYFAAGLLRVMKPGRIVACHCQQLALQKAKHGVIGIRDFRGDLIRAFEAAGFILQGEVTIDKNPQAQAIRTRTKGLAFAQLEKDSAWMRPAFVDYILLLRAPGENAIPIVPDCSRDEWIEWASVWYHCGDSRTLQVAEARDADDEKHICALQLATIERCVRLWSNRDDLVLSPFAGIGSEGYEAILAERRFLGIELKEGYYRTAIKNLRAAELKAAAGMLPFAAPEEVAS